MKKQLFLTFGALFAATTMQAAILSDDTLVINNPRKVTIITGDSLQKIQIAGKENDDDFRYENTIQLVDSNYVSESSINSSRWDFSWPILKRQKAPCKPGDSESNFSPSVGVGFVTALGAPDNMEVTMGQSWEIFWTILQWEYNRCGSPSLWSVGFGLDWRNYRMTDVWRFVKDTESNILIDKYPDGAIPKFSRVKVFSLQVPVLYQYRIGKDFTIGAGPVFNLNTHSSLKTRYKIDGEKYKDTDNDARVTPLTVDFMGVINTPIVNFYVKYSPCNVLQTAHAPKFQSLSVGIYL